MADDAGAIPTDNSVSVQQTSTVVLPGDPTRSFLFIQNDSDTTIYIQIDGTPAALNKGLRLAASGITGASLLFDQNYVPTGAVNAISSGSNKNLLFVEG